MGDVKVEDTGRAEGTIENGCSPVNVLATRVPGAFAMTDDDFWQLVSAFCTQLPLNEDVVAGLRDRQPVLTLHITKGHVMPGSGVSTGTDQGPGLGTEDQAAKKMLSGWTGGAG